MMSPSADPEAEPSDADLVAAVRAGDIAAYGTLYARHAGGARRLAYTLVNDSADADDLVAETFAKVLATLRAGRGPARAFRPYLYTTLRHVRYDRLRLDRRVEFTDDLTRYEAGVPFVDPTVDRLERAYAARAFAQLPERWRAVLWHTDVEGVVAGRDRAPAGSHARRRRGARLPRPRAPAADLPAGTRAAGAAPACRRTTDLLPGYVRGRLGGRARSSVDDHLAGCEPCRASAAEIAAVPAAS